MSGGEGSALTTLKAICQPCGSC
ncbi:hypothetical protein C365_01374 [Cryptococcus neoformans Bt85]|nr:hypothetical protein C365_01374 [Cryptococcus neoformans var. grubii Bt85]OXM80812.1 hypothetical protein C364_01181 [Cryptococcus neoformans var. grubii Bt63]